MIIQNLFSFFVSLCLKFQFCTENHTQMANKINQTNVKQKICLFVLMKEKKYFYLFVIVVTTVFVFSLSHPLLLFAQFLILFCFSNGFVKKMPLIGAMICYRYAFFYIFSAFDGKTSFVVIVWFLSVDHW